MAMDGKWKELQIFATQIDFDSQDELVELLVRAIPLVAERDNDKQPTLDSVLTTASMIWFYSESKTTADMKNGDYAKCERLKRRLIDVVDSVKFKKRVRLHSENTVSVAAVEAEDIPSELRHEAVGKETSLQLFRIARRLCASMRTFKNADLRAEYELLPNRRRLTSDAVKTWLGDNTLAGIFERDGERRATTYRLCSK